jgi:hypothetical protein
LTKRWRKTSLSESLRALEKWLKRYLFTLRWYDMNGSSQRRGVKNWILPKEITANRFFEAPIGWNSA